MIESAKERIISPWLLGLMALLLAAAVYSMRPSQEGMAKELASRPASDLSVIYLKSWLRVAPNSPRLLELLGQQYLGLGRWDDALAISSRLVHLGGARYRQEGTRLSLQAIERHAFQYPPGDARRNALVAQLDGLLHTLASSEDNVQTLVYLVNLAQAIGAREVTWQLYEQLAKVDTGRAVVWHVLQGKRALADGLYDDAALAYFDAQRLSPSLDGQRTNFIAAVDALRAGDKVERACDQAAQHLGNLANDPQTLRYLIGVAREAQRYDLMRQYAERLAHQVSMAPRYMDGLNGARQLGWVAPPRLVLAAATAGEPPAGKPATRGSDLDLLYRTFLESHALKDAQATAQHALSQSGTDRRLWLSRLGQVAEWNNQPAVALKAWQALAEEFHDPKAWDNVLRLAPQLGDVKLWATALQHAVQADPADSQKVGQLLAAYERGGERQRALDELQQLPGMKGEKASANAIAALQVVAASARKAGATYSLPPLYRRLAQVDPERAAHWYGSAGEIEISIEQYQAAAQDYFQAQDHSHTLEDKRRAFLAALTALKSGDKVALACDQAELHIDGLANDPVTLRFLIGIAREAARYDLMRKYGEALSKVISLAPRYLDGPNGAIQLGLVSPVRLRLVASEQGGAGQQSPVTSDLDLLYHTFVESGAMADAVKTAQRALARPDADRRVWLARLAKVAEWNNQPDLALKAWQELAQKYNDAAAWKQVQRMAPQLDNDQALLAALRHAAKADPGNVQLAGQVVAAYERVGNPEGGLAFLREQGATRQMREMLATLAERSGHDDLAIATWQWLQKHYGPSPSYALHIASLLYAQHKTDEALNALQVARKVAEQQKPPADFWSTYLSLARVLGDRSGQNKAVAAMLEQHTATPADYANILYYYDGYPLDKGRIAEAAFHQTGNLAYLQQAITSYAQIRAWKRVHDLLAGLTDADRKSMEKMPALLEARASYLQATGNPQGALQDLRRAYQLPGGADVAGQSYLWALLSFGTRDETRRVARQMAARHGSEPGYASVLAAAMQQLNQPRRALAYMNMAGIPSQEDPLWLVNYASVEESLGRPELAWRIRRRAWQLLAQRSEFYRRTLDGQGAMIHLGQMFRSGDVSMALLVSLLRNGPPDGAKQAVARSILGDVPGIPSREQIASESSSAKAGHNHSVDAAVYALTVAWAMDGQHNDLARAWLGNRYVSEMLKPASAQLALALMDNDKPRLSTLLAKDSSSLSASDRAQALERLGHLPAAQTEAHTALAGAPDNDQHYEDWVDLALKQQPSAGLRTEYTSVNPLETRSIFVDAGLKLTNHLGLKLRDTERFNSTSDESQLAWVPRRDEETSIALIHSDVAHRYELEVGRRDALAVQTTGLLTAAWMSDNHVNLTLQAGVNQYTDVDTLLTLGGSKDFVSAELSWDSQRDWFSSLAVERARYKTQEGLRLGTGTDFTATLGYHLQTQGTPIDLSAYVTHWGFSRGSGPVPEFARFMPNNETPDASDVMPQNNVQYGLTLTLGNDQLTTYQRAWRPYLSVSLIHDSQQGWGPGVSAGIGGSVLGRDRLGIYAMYESASRGESKRTTRVGLYYRFFY